MPLSTVLAPRQRSSIESFLDDYQAVRLTVNAAALVVVIAAWVGDWAPLDGLVLPRMALLSLITIHAAWCSVRRVRLPKAMLLLDITLLGGVMFTLPGYTSVMTGIFGFLALVAVLFTERSLPYFLAYLTAWYALAFLNGGEITTARIGDLFGSVFVVGAVVAVMIRIRSWLARLDASRSQTIGTVSHELRSNLTGVLGFTELAAETAGSEESEIRNLVLAAHQQAVDANQIVEDLLTTSRAEASTLRVNTEAVDVNEEASTVARRFHGAAEEIHLRLASGLPLVAADALRVRQAVRNLVSNAIRYGGPEITIITEALGDRVQLIVRDNGDGVPTEDETSIFLPYRRSTRGRQDPNSIGLGLWVCRHLAHAMGGDLEYRRNESYTEFVLTLPVAPGSPASDEDGALNRSRV
ncbi:MAG: HAMP domain-containing sensor histidine kinase [Acidimicrobiia bacterium]